MKYYYITVYIDDILHSLTIKIKEKELRYSRLIYGLKNETNAKSVVIHGINDKKGDKSIYTSHSAFGKACAPYYS